MEKVNQQIRKQITEVLRKEIDDPDFDFLSVTRVETTSDLQECKVYFSLLDESGYVKAEQALGKMSGFIRNILGKKVRLKVLPQLFFIPDKSIKYSVDVYQKMEEINALEKGATENAD